CDRHRVDLRDRVGAAFPVTPDAGCRNTVYNAVPQSAAEYVSQMLGLGLRRFRVELLRETPEQVAPLVEAYRRVIAGTDDGHTTWKHSRPLTQLGVPRAPLGLMRAPGFSKTRLYSKGWRGPGREPWPGPDVPAESMEVARLPISPGGSHDLRHLIGI